MECSLTYLHDHTTKRICRASEVSKHKHFHVKSIEEAKQKSLAIIQNSVKHWKRKDAILSIAFFFLKEEGEKDYTYCFQFRRSHRRNRKQILQTNIECWRVYGEDTDD